MTEFFGVKEPEHPIEAAMDYPVDGCECSTCQYARWFDTLTPAEQRHELKLIYLYGGDDE